MKFVKLIHLTLILYIEEICDFDKIFIANLLSYGVVSRFLCLLSLLNVKNDLAHFSRLESTSFQSFHENTSPLIFKSNLKSQFLKFLLCLSY